MSLIDTQQYLAPHHQARDFGLVSLAGNQFTGVFASSQDSDSIGEFQHFAQFVRNEDNGLAALYQAPQHAKELKRLLWRKHARRLVHNQDIGGAVEHFEYLDPLL